MVCWEHEQPLLVLAPCYRCTELAATAHAYSCFFSHRDMPRLKPVTCSFLEPSTALNYQDNNGKSHEQEASCHGLAKLSKHDFCLSLGNLMVSAPSRRAYCGMQLAAASNDEQSPHSCGNAHLPAYGIFNIPASKKVLSVKTQWSADGF